MLRFRYLIVLALLALLSACGSAPTAIAPTSAAAVATAQVSTATDATTDMPAATTVPPTTVATAPTDAPAAASGDLVVFAAASLIEAFTEIGKNFEVANPGTTVSFNFAGSQQLTQQITQGAPVDVFASANKKQMDAVVAAGQVISGTERTFVRNRLVVVTPKDNPGNISSLNDLTKSGIKLVLADKSVPVGGYSLTFLDKASKLPEYTAEYSLTVLKNVVSYETNVKAVLSKVTLGEADAGIVYTSDISQDAAGKVTTIDIPDALNVIASYPIAPTTNTKQPELAQQFIDYVLSAEGQAMLTKYGFLSY